jgi:hypothetical protein
MSARDFVESGERGTVRFGKVWERGLSVAEFSNTSPSMELESIRRSSGFGRAKALPPIRIADLNPV